MPLEFKNLPLEISALIQDFWIPRGYKNMDTVMQDSFTGALFLRFRYAPGAFALRMSRAWYDYQWQKSGQWRRHTTSRWPLNPTTEHTTWVEWCKVRKILQTNGVRNPPHLRAAYSMCYINNRTGLII
ncbi:MAG: hypothetical protein CMB96_06585 [Flavobacteriaceae bacterium]|nr:hypothetical protein [Flavobacteriaceae bacterium]|tara:strand:- start:2101 stop:2484 length:384 start_codon:yes stop_codon:yes gene_type:complete